MYRSQIVLYLEICIFAQATDRIQIEKDGESHHLVISRVLERDRGEYTVKAVNQAGEASAGATLFVSKEVP